MEYEYITTNHNGTNQNYITHFMFKMV